MRVRYQRGYLRLGRRKTGPDCWEFLWWDIELTGHRVRRKAVIGTVQQYRILKRLGVECRNYNWSDQLRRSSGTRRMDTTT